MKIKLSAILMAALLMVPALYPMQNPQPAPNNAANALNNEATLSLITAALSKVQKEQKEKELKVKEDESWIPKEIRDNKAFRFAQNSIVTYPIRHPIKTLTGLVAFWATHKFVIKYVLNNCSTCRDLTLASVAAMYYYTPGFANWLLDKAAYFLIS